MLRKLSLVSGLIAAAVLVPSSVSAGAQAPLTGLTADSSSIVEQAQILIWDLGRCRAWRRECAERWGWGGARWHRCLARHGCERHRYGDRWDR